MSDDRFDDPSASAGSPRLTALALLIAATATAGIALHPGLAIADGPGPAGTPAAARSADGARATVVPFADDDGTANDPLADLVDDLGVAAEDDGATLGDDDGSAGGAADDGGAGVDPDADGADPADAPINAVVIDRRRRAVEGPKSFAAGRTAKASKLRWTGWNAATAVGTGKIKVRSTGRVHRALRGTGTVTLSRLKVCGDGTPVYRRAVFAVGRKAPITVRLPGCSALR